MKKKIIEWFEIENELRKAMTYPGFALQVWCTINADKIKKVIDVIRSKSTPSEAYEKFSKDALACKQKYYKVDENGNPVIVSSPQGDVFVFEGENKAAFEKEIAPIYEDNKAVIDEYNAMIQEYYKYIQGDEIEIEIKLLNGKYIPAQYFEQNPDKSLAFVQRCLDLIDMTATA